MPCNTLPLTHPRFREDKLTGYGTEEIPEPNQPVVNPARRALDSRRRSLQSQLTRKQSRYAALTLHPEANPEKLLAPVPTKVGMGTWQSRVGGKNPATGA